MANLLNAGNLLRNAGNNAPLNAGGHNPPPNNPLNNNDVLPNGKPINDRRFNQLGIGYYNTLFEFANNYAAVFQRDANRASAEQLAFESFTPTPFGDYDDLHGGGIRSGCVYHLVGKLIGSYVHNYAGMVGVQTVAPFELAGLRAKVWWLSCGHMSRVLLDKKLKNLIDARLPGKGEEVLRDYFRIVEPENVQQFSNEIDDLLQQASEGHRYGLLVVDDIAHLFARSGPDYHIDTPDPAWEAAFQERFNAFLARLFDVAQRCKMPVLLISDVYDPWSVAEDNTHQGYIVSSYHKYFAAAPANLRVLQMHFTYADGSGPGFNPISKDQAIPIHQMLLSNLAGEPVTSHRDPPGEDEPLEFFFSNFFVNAYDQIKQLPRHMPAAIREAAYYDNEALKRNLPVHRQ